MPNLNVRCLMVVGVIAAAGMIAPGRARGQSAAASIGASELSCTISVADAAWSNAKPARVVIKLKNFSDRELRLSPTYYFNLTIAGLRPNDISTAGQGYYMWAGMIRRNGRYRMTPWDFRHMIRLSRTRFRYRNEPLILKKGREVEIAVDLVRFMWADHLEAQRPSRRIFKVVPVGKYDLQFELLGEAIEVYSNSVAITVDRSDTVSQGR